MMHSLKLGSAFGIGIYVHWTFLFLPAWVLLTTWGIVGPPMIVFLLSLLAAVFGCVVLHELGHALMARYFGIQTRDITLLPIGGVARLERMSDRPHEELLIALAGPAVNVVIAGGLAIVLLLTSVVLGGGAQDHAVPSPRMFLEALLFCNLVLVGFNLLPAFPMDGGRVLRAILAGPLGRLRATEIAAHVGAVVAVLLAVVAVVGMAKDIPFLSSPMLILVAGFVLLVGQVELAAVRRREAIRRLAPIDVLPVDEPAPASVEANFTGAVWDHRGRVWVLWHNGRPVARFGRYSE